LIRFAVQVTVHVSTPVIKPISHVVDTKALKSEVEYEYAQLLAKARKLKGSLMVIPSDPSNQRLISPSLLALTCPVAMVMKVKVGLIGTRETFKRIAEGTVYHRHYEQWFRSVNKDFDVYTEMALSNNDTVGVPDIVYCKDTCGLIELKAVWRLDNEHRGAYVRQMAMYYDLLRQSNMNVTEAWLVTMNTVELVGIRELTGKVNEAREYLKAASGNYPDVPPNPKLCVNCILTPVCPSYRNLSNRLLGLGGG